jgi:hypothetical protein
MFDININSAAKYLGTGYINSGLTTDGKPYGSKKIIETADNANKRSNNVAGIRSNAAALSSLKSELDVSQTQVIQDTRDTNKYSIPGTDNYYIPYNYKDSIPDNLKEQIPNTDDSPDKDMKSGNKSLTGEVKGLALTKIKLREAVIWSEIIGEPLCKRRKRR